MTGTQIKALLLSILFTVVVAFVSFQTTYALFSDTATSTNNVFSAASEFPPQTDHIVISEVQTTGGTGGGQDNLTDRDFIELYNPTNSAINLNGYRLIKRAGSGTPTDSNIIVFNSQHSIPPHGYFLWASSGSPGWAASIGADVTTTQTLAIPNNSVALKFGTLETGTIIDALSWSSISDSLVEGTRFTPDLGVNQSMERKALASSNATTMSIGGSDELKGNGYDTNNNSTDFILRSLSQPQNSTSSAETP